MARALAELRAALKDPDIRELVMTMFIQHLGLGPSEVMSCERELKKFAEGVKTQSMLYSGRGNRAVRHVRDGVDGKLLVAAGAVQLFELCTGKRATRESKLTNDFCDKLWHLVNENLARPAQVSEPRPTGEPKLEDEPLSWDHYIRTAQSKAQFLPKGAENRETWEVWPHHDPAARRTLMEAEAEHEIVRTLIQNAGLPGKIRPKL